MVRHTCFLLVLLVLHEGCGRSQRSAPAIDSGLATAPEAGPDARGIPRYTQREFTAEERALLRNAYGIEDPELLYVSDSSEDGLLKYDTQRKRCARCYVNSYGIGFVSIRRSGESWEALERR